MFSRFLSRVSALAPRTAEWASKAGPVAILGCDYGVAGSGRAMLDAIGRGSRDADYYAELVFHDKAPVELPPDTVAFMPVLRCGDMTEGAGDGHTAADWYVSTAQAIGDLAEKGYIPLIVGGGGGATLPALEAIKKIHADEEIILLHFSADAGVGDAAAPVRVIQEKGLVKGVISLGNRMVSAEDRKVRREKKMHYLDAHALFSKGLFCVRDLRNDFPVYISIDVGALDPSVAPGAIRQESGGFTARELLHLLHGIRAPKVLGIDIHGYDPAIDVLRQDGIGLSTFPIAKLAKEAVLKAYSISTATQDEGLARVQMMQRQGTLSDSQYPEH